MVLDDVFLDPLWFFNNKKILWGGYGLYVGPFLILGPFIIYLLGLILWACAYLWAMLVRICDGLRKGRGRVAGRGAGWARLRRIAVILCI